MLLAMPALAQAEGLALGIGLVFLFILIALAVAQLILFIAGVVSVLGSDRYSAAGKLIWIVVMLFLPIIGPIVWFIVGRNVKQGI